VAGQPENRTGMGGAMMRCAAVLHAVRSQEPGYGSSYHRVCSRGRRSAGVLAHTLIRFLLADVAPPGPVLPADYDTITEHPGPKDFGKGQHGDGTQSSHRYTVYRWEHTWLEPAILAVPAVKRLFCDPMLATHIAGLFPGLSASRKIRIICSSVNRGVRFSSSPLQHTRDA
jgi:hypothetical protein